MQMLTTQPVSHHAACISRWHLLLHLNMQFYLKVLYFQRKNIKTYFPAGCRAFLPFIGVFTLTNLI